MQIDFSKQNTIDEKKALVYALYQRFNENYGNYVDMNLVTDALNNIAITEKMQGLATSAFFNSEDGKIYIKEDVNINTLFHEILHFITSEHHGMGFSILKACSDDEYLRLIDKYGETQFYDQVAMMDESFTTFITELAIPEIEYTNLYEYGVDFLRMYYTELLNNNIDVTFIFNMYFNDSPEDALRFIEPFGQNFEYIMDSVEKSNNTKSFGKIIKAQRNNPHLTVEDILGKTLTKQELKEYILDAINYMKTR